MGVMEVDVPLLMFSVWLPVFAFLSRNSNTFRYESVQYRDVKG